MADIRIKWNNKAFYELRASPGVRQELERRGNSVVDAANATLPEGEGYQISSSQRPRKPQGRWFVQVYAASRHAKHSDALNNTLLRVLDEAK